MIADRRLREELEIVARNHRRLFGALACAIVWLATAAAGAALLAVGKEAGWTASWPAWALAVGALVAGGGAYGLVARRTRDAHWIARQIEKKYPEIDSLLITAVEQKPHLPDGRFGFLQDRVIADSLALAGRLRWRDDVPARRILAAQAVGLASLALLALVVVALSTQADGARRLAGPPPGPKPASLAAPSEVAVSPGDAEIERGTSLVVTARFDGGLPDDATLVIQQAPGEFLRVPMSLSLSDPIFGARVPDVQHDLSYRVEYAGRATADYRVTVFEYPQLVRADAELEFPKYTSLPKKRVEDTRRITAVEGTQVTLTCDLNKPVETARLVDEEGGRLELSAGGNPRVYSVTHLLKESKRYRLELVDAQGRSNKEPPQIVFNVTPNRPPEVKITLPARDMRVSPIEELQTKANVWDDFGLRAYGLSYTLPGRSPQELVLGRSAPAGERREVDHLIPFEDLQAEPDQLLAYYFWAEDVGPDGNPRRTLGDMYFAEVRHFDEIFRQGEQPPAGQSQQEQQQQQGGQTAQQAEQLAELQKQVIAATWTIIRRETGAQPTAEFSTDLEEVKTAQADAIAKLGQFTEKLDDAQSQQNAAAAKGHMLDAMAGLTQAGENASPAVLPKALAAEQAAYQALLRLRAREHEVTRSRQSSQQRPSGSASGPQSRAQQQLEQLALDNSENRYETERQAAPQQEQQQRETLQVLNRLRELARRQNDLNERLKELQSALQEAQSDQEREEIERQLKRLREQQQEMLRDTDELAERMQRPENQERMSQSRQQLDETRERIRQTTEALREGQVSQALANGARAQSQLEKMQEEFRNAASSRFSDQARQLRDQARQLDQQERDLAQQLEQLETARQNTRSLRAPDRREEVRDGFRRQGEDLDRLMENMRKTVEEAGEAEPLMTRQLYDSARQAGQQRVDDALGATGELVDRGLVGEARLAEEQASRGIEELRQGVEKAAESVLGNEEESLRRAHETLQALAAQLEEEIRRETGQTPGAQSKDSPRSVQPGGERQQAASDRPGQPPEQPSDQPPGGATRNQPLENPPEQNQTGQNQPGQNQPGQNQPRADQPNQDGSPRQGRQTAGRLRDGQPRRAAQSPTGIDEFHTPDGPITGDFLPWSDRLREVEEMIDDARLRSDAARVREAARDIRRQMHRDFKGPNWDLVRESVSKPLNELRDRVADELRRRQPDDATAPIDRDPVPARFADQVRRYYEKLGSGQ